MHLSDARRIISRRWLLPPPNEQTKEINGFLVNHQSLSPLQTQPATRQFSLSLSLWIARHNGFLQYGSSLVASSFTLLDAGTARLEEVRKTNT